MRYLPVSALLLAMLATSCCNTSVHDYSGFYELCVSVPYNEQPFSEPYYELKEVEREQLSLWANDSTFQFACYYTYGKGKWAHINNNIFLYFNPEGVEAGLETGGITLSADTMVFTCKGHNLYQWGKRKLTKKGNEPKPLRLHTWLSAKSK